MLPRVLLSTIQRHGKMPCPRCLIKLEEISQVRTPQDIERRQDLRLNNKDRDRRVEKARRLMFVKGITVKGKKVEELFSEKSLVPTRVHTNYRIHALIGTDKFPLECLFEKAHDNWISNVRDLCCQSTSRNRAWCMEVHVDTSYSHSAHAT